MIKVICNENEKNGVAELLLNELTTMNLNGVGLPSERFDDVKRIISKDDNMKVYLTDGGVMTNIDSTDVGFIIVMKLTKKTAIWIVITLTKLKI